MLHVQTCYRGGDVNGRPGWFMSFNYCSDFQDCIDELKAAVPADERSYSEETHEWWISEAWAKRITGFIGGLEAHLLQKALPGF